MSLDPWDAEHGGAGEELVAGIVVSDRLDAALGCLDPCQAGHVLCRGVGLIFEPPATTVMARQGHAVHPTVLERYLVAGFAEIGVQMVGDQVVLIGDGQQLQAGTVNDAGQAAMFAEPAFMAQLDPAARWRIDPMRHGNIEPARADDFQLFHHARAVHDPVLAVAIVQEAEALELLLADFRFGATAIDMELLAGVYLQRAGGGDVAREIEGPALAKAGVFRRQGVEGQTQGQVGANQVVTDHCHQVNAKRVLAGAWVDAVIHKTEVVVRVGVGR
ncbi:hypothetical protein D3C81_1362900 [compost metagenome]